MPLGKWLEGLRQLGISVNIKLSNALLKHSLFICFGKLQSTLVDAALQSPEYDLNGLSLWHFLLNGLEYSVHDNCSQGI